MKEYVAAEVQLRSFLAFLPDGREWSLLHIDRRIPGDLHPDRKFREARSRCGRFE